MIIINVWANNYIEIESERFIINDRNDFITFIGALIDSCYYAGETILLQKVDILGLENHYTEIKKWK